MSTEGEADQISLRLYGNLARFAGDRNDAFIVGIAPGETAAQLAARFNLPSSEVSVIIVNRQKVGWDCVLQPGDEVQMLGVVGGG